MHRIYSIFHMTLTQNLIIAVKSRSNESYKEPDDHDLADEIITRKKKTHRTMKIILHSLSKLFKNKNRRYFSVNFLTCFGDAYIKHLSQQKCLSIGCEILFLPKV